MDKNADLTFNISATTNQQITTTIRFSTQDEGSAKLTFFLYKDGVVLPLNAVEGKLAMRMADGSIFRSNVVIVDKVNGVAEYSLTPEQLKHYGRVNAELYLNYDNNQKMSVHRFSFTIEKALIDADIALLTEFYVDDFSNLKETINGMANETTATIQAVGESVDEAKGKANETIALIEQNQAVKLPEYEENKQQVTAQLSATANYVTARSLSGNTGGEKIQNALNSNFPFSSPNKTVAIDGIGMDENGCWLLKEPLKIPSNTTLLLNGCYIKLDTAVNNIIITNDDYENGNENIHINVQGKVVFDCNQANQDFTNAYSYQKLGIHFYNVNFFSIRGATIKDPYKQGLVLEKCKYGVVDDIYFDTEGLINQDGVHILGPSSDIIVTKIRGVVGDDALVVNSRSNPAQGYGSGGDVTDIVFDDIIIRGGTASNGGAHTGLLRTAPGAEYKIENISLSNAIGHNLKDAILRFGGNEIAPIENHKKVTVNNVQGFEGTSGPISLVYMNTPVMDTKIDGAIIETSNDALFTNRGLDVDGLQMSNIMRKLNSVSGETIQQSSIELINADIKNVQIDTIQDNHQSISTEFLISVAGSNVENIQVSKVVAKNIKKYLDTTNANISNVRYDEVVVNTSDAVAYGGITGDKDVVVNKYAIETSGTTSKTPTRTNYQTGDAVLYRQSETSQYTLYFKDHANGWRRIDNEIINGIRLTIDFGTIPANTAKTIDVPYASSDNSIFYQVKPSFNLPINVLFSVQNYAAGKIRITVFNANPTAVTFSSQDWLAIGTQAKFS
ncbi:BppU family phage baseplate upper protein [Niallia taxi]|uniref:phage baseplate upper protein n=1 Tax=Niallia taxi TaxID=2499688 RepID=UPI0031733CFD